MEINKPTIEEIAKLANIDIARYIKRDAKRS
jgi:hypothetical protein